MSSLTKLNIPPIYSDNGLTGYLTEIRKFPMLSKEDEQEYGRRFAEEGDIEAAHHLVTSHLRLVVKLAMNYKGYGLPVSDLISEGNVGLMQAVKRFDAEKGFRLSTYAMWWIKAAIQEYILHSWSLVKIGTTTAQKKLFFNLRKLKSGLRAFDALDLTPEKIQLIANELDVTETDVINMNQRLSSPDHSLNSPLRDGGGQEWIDWIEDGNIDQESELLSSQEHEIRSGLLKNAMDVLNDREKNILFERRLSDKPKTLEELSIIYGISRERVRQIEAKAFQKLQSSVMEKAEGLAL